ncbi:hypothetical protein F511_20407 [Dorcoceras hygrometricum]|uniref:Uncharacterized protein n=1 Tax=Dorcoceras hygrometricum TaxID=472368 RepID=A0A2Z7DAL8_9LAMI|nr:hypothetical protein F511_20407 [Dorcoceras hygrometricum]
MPRIVLPLTAHGRAPITQPPRSMVRNQRRNNCAGRWLATASHVHNNLRTTVDLHVCSGAKHPATMRNGLRITVARWLCNAGHQITQRVRETSDAGRPLSACDAHAGRGAAARGGGAWLRPVSRGNWHFTVGGGRLRQSGPRPEGRLLRQPALEGLTRSSTLSITDSACKNQLVVVSVQYGPFNPYIPIRSTTIGKSRVVKEPIAMHTSWRSNSDIASVTRASMSFRVVRTNQYNQDLGLIHSTNGNHLESPNEGSYSTSRRKQQYIQTRATMNQLLLCIQSQDDVPVTSYSGSSRRLQRVATSRQRIQSRATVDPVAGYSAIAYSVDMESRRKKSRSSEELQPGAKNPVAAVKETTSSKAVDEIYYEELLTLDVNC